jgi:hypothetical protein
MNALRTRCILAVDARPIRFGYAAFEGPTRLIDFGVRRWVSPQQASARIAALLASTRPRIIVLRKISTHSSRNRLRTKNVIRAICRAAQRSSIRIAFVTEQQLKNHFLKDGTRTKYQIAASLARKFPELLWRLPAQRKAWETEHWRMPIFDATALGVVHFAMTPSTQRRPATDEESFRRSLDGAAI